MLKGEIKEEIDRLMSVIPHCPTRKEALDIQEQIEKLETELENL